MAKAKTRAPEVTLREAEYLRELITRQQTVCVRLEDNSEYQGVVEYFDLSFLRLTCDQSPNLFIYKHEIKYIYEVAF